MNKVKELIIRKMLKWKIEKVEEGNLYLAFDSIVKMKDDYIEYYYLLDKVPSIINGIKKVNILIKENKVVIEYNVSIINEIKIQTILEEVKELVIENWDYISDNKEENIDEVVKVLSEKLLKRVN
ncbi:MAG: hypothetical protein ACRC41_06225 [Sarcina sp.]